MTFMKINLNLNNIYQPVEKNADVDLLINIQ